MKLNTFYIRFGKDKNKNNRKNRRRQGIKNGLLLFKLFKKYDLIFPKVYLVGLFTC
jgi:hypothetical protein